MVIDHALGPAVHAALGRAASEMGGQLVHGSVGQPGHGGGDRPETRRDRISRLPVGSSVWQAGLSARLLEGIRALKATFIDALHPALLQLLPADRPPVFPREELQFACYEGGGFYKPHQDAEVRPTAINAQVGRVYTAIYYPNRAVWGADDGGELRIWPEGAYEAVEVEPIGDRLVIFDSSLVHEVLPLSPSAPEPRCAFTQWFSAVRAIRWSESGER